MWDFANFFTQLFGNGLTTKKAKSTCIYLAYACNVSFVTFFTTQSSFQLKKLQDRVAKAKEQVNKCRENYQVALQDINNYNPKYMEEMTNVFEQCQRMEAQRLQQFKDTLFSVQKCLNISEDVVYVFNDKYPLIIRLINDYLTCRLPQIYAEFHHTIENADHEKDLRWWSNTHGVHMPMNWPQFEVGH